MSKTGKLGFTPGPWTVSQQRGLRLFIVAAYEAIAEVLPRTHAPSDQMLFADAALISTAPELYEALGWALEVIWEEFHVSGHVVADVVRKEYEAAEVVLAKAKGGKICE